MRRSLPEPDSWGGTKALFFSPSLPATFFFNYCRREGVCACSCLRSCACPLLELAKVTCECTKLCAERMHAWMGGFRGRTIVANILWWRKKVNSTFESAPFPRAVLRAVFLLSTIVERVLVNLSQVYWRFVRELACQGVWEYLLAAGPI